jgi:hypothetical protein
MAEKLNIPRIKQSDFTIVPSGTTSQYAEKIIKESGISSPESHMNSGLIGSALIGGGVATHAYKRYKQIDNFNKNSDTTQIMKQKVKQFAIDTFDYFKSTKDTSLEASPGLERRVIGFSQEVPQAKPVPSKTSFPKKMPYASLAIAAGVALWSYGSVQDYDLKRSLTIAKDNNNQTLNATILIDNSGAFVGDYKASNFHFKFNDNNELVASNSGEIKGDSLQKVSDQAVDLSTYEKPLPNGEQLLLDIFKTAQLEKDQSPLSLKTTKDFLLANKDKFTNPQLKECIKNLEPDQSNPKQQNSSSKTTPETPEISTTILEADLKNHVDKILKDNKDKLSKLSREDKIIFLKAHLRVNIPKISDQDLGLIDQLYQ